MFFTLDNPALHDPQPAERWLRATGVALGVDVAPVSSPVHAVLNDTPPLTRAFLMAVESGESYEDAEPKLIRALLGERYRDTALPRATVSKSIPERAEPFKAAARAKLDETIPRIVELAAVVPDLSIDTAFNNDHVAETKELWALLGRLGSLAQLAAGTRNIVETGPRARTLALIAKPAKVYEKRQGAGSPEEAVRALASDSRDIDDVVLAVARGEGGLVLDVAADVAGFRARVASFEAALVAPRIDI